MTGDRDPVHIRPAVASDLEFLTTLALRSKAHWGYDAAFLDACRDELTITRARLGEEVIRVAEDGGGVLGFMSVRVGPAEAELVDLFVEPAAIGTGVGRALWDEAVRIALAAGAARLLVEADPHAEGWYLRRGAERIGTVPSGSIAGRRLPLLGVSLGAGGDGTTTGVPDPRGRAASPPP